MPKLIRVTTVPISLKLLLTGQMSFLRENGFEVLMASADGKERQQVIENENCPHIIIPMTRAITPLKDAKCLWMLWRLFLKEKPDIVHSHTPKAGLLAMLAARLAGVPIRVHTVAGLPLMTASGFTKQVLIRMEQLTYWASTEVWPNSLNLCEFIRQHLHRSAKVRTIGSGSSNGIDLGQFSRNSVPQTVLERIKSRIGWEENCTYVLFVGRIVRDKGVVELVEAFSNLQSSYPRLRLLLIGKTEKVRKEENLPEHILYQIKNNRSIRHIDWTDDVAHYLALADLLVHPSHREGFPNVLLQAGAMECPIVCSDISGNTDLIAHQATGVLFEVKNAKDLEEKLAFAIKNPEKMRRQAAILLAIIRQDFDRKQFHRQLLNEYFRLLENKRIELPDSRFASAC